MFNLKIIWLIFCNHIAHLHNNHNIVGIFKHMFMILLYTATPQPYNTQYDNNRFRKYVACSCFAIANRCVKIKTFA